MPIRPAQPKDSPAISQLLAQILSHHHAIRPDMFKEKGGKYDEEYLIKLFDNPDTPVFVYVDDQDRVLGHLFLQIKSPDNPVRTPVKTLYIDDLCVDKYARGLGIGKQLYAFAKAYAKEQDCYNLTLNVWADNVQALNFYQSLGLKTQQIQMEELL